MDDEYNLSAGEAVIMQSDGVELLCGRESEELDELVLTNKNLILVNEVSVGIFTTQRLVKRCPLDSILCPEGSPQAFLGKKKDSYVLQVAFEQEAITLRFPDNERREAKRWADAIKCAVVGDLDSIETEESKLPPEATSFVDGFKGLASAFISEATETASSAAKVEKPIKKVAKTVAAGRCTGCRAPLSGIKGAIVTCDYCGTKQTL